MENNTEEKGLLQKKVKEETEKIIKGILDDGINTENIDILYKTIDIHKDIGNEEYWEEMKEDESMRYRAYGRDAYGEYERSSYNDGTMGNYSNYSNYGNEGSYGRRSRDSRGRYTERGRDAKYRGHEMIDEVYEAYGEYSEGREQYGRGNYSAKEDTMKSLDYMMQSVVQFIQMLQQDAETQEEAELIKKYTRKISEM